MKVILTEHQFRKIILKEQRRSPQQAGAVSDYRPVFGKKEERKCMKEWRNALPPAIKFWRRWLNNPITKKKFYNNALKTTNNLIYSLHPDINAEDVNKIFKEYNDLLDKIEIIYIQDLKRPSLAHFNSSAGNEEIIFVNTMSCKTSADKLRILIHEIQHVLHNHFPLNPDKEVGEIFVTPSTTLLEPFYFINPIKDVNIIDKVDREWYIIKKEVGNLGAYEWLRNINGWRYRVKKISTELDITVVNAAKLLKKWYLSSHNQDKKYVCDTNENMSNIMELRKLLKISPGDKITVELLTPYLLFPKEYTIEWLMGCWALKGFVDLEGVVNRMNELAMNNSEQDDTWA